MKIFLLSLWLSFLKSYAVDVGGAGGGAATGLKTSFDNLMVRGKDITRSPVINASAALEVNSVTQGFLPPIMVEAQRDAIVAPAIGLTIYNLTRTDTEVWDGFYWTDYGSNINTNGGGVNLATGVWTTMNSWTVEQYDPNRYIAVPGSSFTIPRDGSYFLSNTAVWQNVSSVGVRCLRFSVPVASSPSGYVGATCMQCPTSGGPDGSRHSQSTSAVVYLRKGDLVSVQGFQDSGGNMTMGTQVGMYQFFSISPVGR